MRTVKNITGCSCVLNIEVSPEELRPEFDQVYLNIRQKARIPGFRPGKAPRDLLETYYAKEAQEEVIRRAIPEYYLKSVEAEKLSPVAPPEIDHVQFANHTLIFTAKVDVRPQIKLKNYKNLRLTKKKLAVTEVQVNGAMERLRSSTAQPKENLELNDSFAQKLGFNTLVELKAAVEQSLKDSAEQQIRLELERQLFEMLAERATLEVPQTLLNKQTQELLRELKLNRILQGEKKEDVESKTKELEEEAQKEARRRVRLSFIIEEIAQQEDIQVSEEDLEKRITEIARRTGKDSAQVREYLDRQHLLPDLKQELRDRKTIEFLLSKAKIEEES